MRIWSLARWVIVLALIGWSGYTLAGAGWTYFATQELVDQVLREASSRYRTAIATGSEMDGVVNHVRNSIILNARRDGLLLQEGDVQVLANSAGISATVRWPHPILTYGTDDLLVVPMSIRRSYVVAP
jgi:hypothetical protein